jgi:hypothetical protein
VQNRPIFVYQRLVVQNRLNSCIHGVVDVQLLDSLLMVCAILHMIFLTVDVIYEDMDRLFSTCYLNLAMCALCHISY